MRLLLLTGLVAFTAFGQPAFEVASVKLNSTAGADVTRRVRETIAPSPAGVTMMHVHLRSVVQWAYHVQAIQVSGPGWLDNDTYDILAKAAGAVPTDQLRVMMQTLLADRFKLTLHRETKVMPAYVVTVAKGGHKMKESQTEGELDVKPNGGGMSASFTRVSMTQLLEMGSSQIPGVVVDQTGLTGRYDFTLDMSSFMSGDFKPTGIEDVITILIQAVGEQLGIKIEQKKVPAEMLIVDHAERVPTEN